MELQLLRLLKIEKEMKSIFEQMLFIEKNSNKQSFKSQRHEELFNKIVEEEEQLNLRAISFNKINEYIEILEKEFYERNIDYSFDDFFFSDDFFDEKIRLYSYLKKQKMLYLFNKMQFGFLNNLEKEFYYNTLFEARLFDAYQDFNLKTSLKANEESLNLFYILMFSFVCLEYDTELCLKNWLKNSFFEEDYLNFEKNKIIFILKNDIFPFINQCDRITLQCLFEDRFIVSRVAIYLEMAIKIMGIDALKEEVSNFLGYHTNIIIDYLTRTNQKVTHLRRIK